MTSKLRAKLDALPPRLAGQSLELSHSVLDFDLIEEENILFKILQEHNPDIDYLLGKFYNGIKRPASDGLFLSDPDSPAHLIGAGEIYESSVNSIFGGDATRVVFGFCVSDCASTLSNSNSSEAVKILKDLKSYNDGAFSCFGGAFFWRALNDPQSSWSSLVWNEIMLTSGCSNNYTVPKVSSKAPGILQAADLFP